MQLQLDCITLVDVIQTAFNVIRWCFFFLSVLPPPPTIDFVPFGLSLNEVTAHKENQHVWINFALCLCLSGMLLEPLLVFCVSAPDWAWQLCTISCHRTQLHRQRNKRKQQMLWLNCPSKPFHSHLCHVKLISQWADLISQMLLLQVSTPSSGDCQRHKAREVVLERLCLHMHASNQRYCSSSWGLCFL